jgi:hypothetical protein
MYERIHHKVRGEWDNDVWNNYIAYQARAVALPWDPAAGEKTEAQRAAVAKEIAASTGLDLETVLAAGKSGTSGASKK